MMICILNLGLVKICSYSLRITIETINLKQILEKKILVKNEIIKIWKLNLKKEESN